MKLFKSLLLGSAAGLIAVSGASAADLGVKKPAPVEYVKVCSAHGAGFFYIPGSDVCMQISGRVRAEYQAATTWTRADDASSFRAHGRINVDTRQTTAFGLLRTYVRMEQYADTGRYHGLAGAQGFTTEGSILNKAFIQFYTGTAGFFTAGRAVSFFDAYALDGPNWGRTISSDRDNVNLFAYTFTFGGGLSASISVENNLQRNVTNAGSITYAGQRMPDLVGNLRVDQAWGSAQLSGAVHQMNLMNRTPTGDYVDTAYGWAVQGGLKVNLPMIAAGDALWLQAAYSQGALDYAGVSRYTNDALFGRVRGTINNADGYIDALGNTKKASSWSVTAAFVHNFTPSIQMALFGAYGAVDYPSSSAWDYKAYNIGGRINWIPVRNFTIGTELTYNVIDPNGTGNAVAGVAAKGKYDSLNLRIRFQREF